MDAHSVAGATLAVEHDGAALKQHHHGAGATLIGPRYGFGTRSGNRWNPAGPRASASLACPHRNAGVRVSDWTVDGVASSAGARIPYFYQRSESVFLRSHRGTCSPPVGWHHRFALCGRDISVAKRN